MHPCRTRSGAGAASCSLSSGIEWCLDLGRSPKGSPDVGGGLRLIMCSDQGARDHDEGREGESAA